MHLLNALVKRRFDCAYQRGQAWKTIGLASCRMTCLARAHAHSKPRIRVHHLLVTASRTLTRRATSAWAERSRSRADLYRAVAFIFL